VPSAEPSATIYILNPRIKGIDHSWFFHRFFTPFSRLFHGSVKQINLVAGYGYRNFVHFFHGKPQKKFLWLTAPTTNSDQRTTNDLFFNDQNMTHARARRRG
jgi:hypothetical protein